MWSEHPAGHLKISWLISLWNLRYEILAIITLLISLNSWNCFFFQDLWNTFDILSWIMNHILMLNYSSFNEILCINSLISFAIFFRSLFAYKNQSKPNVRIDVKIWQGFQNKDLSADKIIKLINILETTIDDFIRSFK